MSRKQRVGTLKCWLWGHNFVFWEIERDVEKRTEKRLLVKSNYCVRCGAKRQEGAC